MCKDSADWFCEMVTKKMVALVFGILASILALVAGCCGCGTFCCPNSFTELAEAPPAVGGVVQGYGQPAYAQPAVVGQPVGQEGNEKM